MSASSEFRNFLIGIRLGALSTFVYAASSGLAWATTLHTNAVVFENAPSWLSERRIDKVVDRIEAHLEWDIRRISARRVEDQKEFQKLHGYDESVLAFSQRSDQRVVVGPRVTGENFDAIFGHELVHVILFPKYKNAIPPWLEEGLANKLSGHGKVDYVWLSQQTLPKVQSLGHPFRAAQVPARLHYTLSTAVAEMIASRCSLPDLLQLAVGKSFETFLSQTCELKSLDAEVKRWIQKRLSR